MYGFYYSESLTANDPSWGDAIDFGFWAKNVMLQTMEAEGAEFSFNGQEVHGVLPASMSEPRPFYGLKQNRIWIRSASGGKKVQIHAWIGGE